MIDGWKTWEGKKVFITTRSNRHYTGKVTSVEILESPSLIWITIIDKFGSQITFSHSEINLIEEEK